MWSLSHSAEGLGGQSGYKIPVRICFIQHCAFSLSSSLQWLYPLAWPALVDLCSKDRSFVLWLWVRKKDSHSHALFFVVYSSTMNIHISLLAVSFRRFLHILFQQNDEAPSMATQSLRVSDLEIDGATLVSWH